MGKKEDAIRKSLQWIKDNSTVDDEGSVSTTVSIPYYAAKEIIVRYSNIDESIPEGTCRRIVDSAVRRWLKYKKYRENSDLFSAFSQALQVEVRQFEKKREKLSVLMFLNIDRRDIEQIEPISVLGDNVPLKRWGQLSFLSTDELWKEVELLSRTNSVLQGRDQGDLLPKKSIFQPVLFDVETYGPEAAVAIAEDRLDILRAILNTSMVLGRFTYFRSEPKHLSAVLPSPIYGVFDSSGNLVWPYYTIERYDYRKARIRDKQLSSAEHLLRIFSQPLEYPSTNHQVLGLLRLYQDALDITLPRQAYFAMWQVVESAVTFNKEGREGLSPRDVVGRVSTLTGQDPFPFFRDALRLLADLRNDLVHSGEFLERGDDALFMLKLVADTCIMRLLSLAKDFSTIEELKEYISLVSLGDSDLARKETVISLIQEYRAKS